MAGSGLPPEGAPGARRLPRLSQWYVAPFLRPLEAAAATAAKAAAAAAAEGAAGETNEETEQEETATLEQQQPDAWRCTTVLQGQHRGIIYAVAVHPKKDILATVGMRD